MGSNKNHESLKRQWLLLNRIPRRGKKGTRYFQEALQDIGLEVSIRTIQRDLNELSRYFPLQCDEEKISGWKWAEDAPSFDIPGMDPHAALAFKMIDLHLGKMLPANCLKFLQPYNKRADDVLSNLEDGGVAEWPQKVARISRNQPLLPPEIDSFVLSTIYDGLLLNRQLDIAYCNRDSNIAQAGVIHPLGLVFVDNVAYLVCTFWEYEDLRQIALHRIQSADLLEAKADKPEGFNLKTYIEQGHFGIRQSDDLIHLKCLFNNDIAKHLEESPLNESQKLIMHEDGRLLLEAKVHDTAQLQWWLLGFGSQVEVVEPQKLRKSTIETCKQMIEMYR